MSRPPQLASGRIFTANMPILPGLGDRCVPGNGPLDACVVAVGEAPGRNEHYGGIPFCGDAGQELDTYSFRFGHLDRYEWYITNVVKQRPPDNRDPRPDEIEYWTPVLYRELEYIKPTIILALGGYATRFFLPEYDLETIHGIPMPLDGTRFNIPHPVTLISCYHPAGGIHDTDMIPFIVSDMTQIGKYLKRPFEHIQDQFPDPDYRILDDSHSSWIEDLAARADYMHLDTEENGWCLTLSVQPGTGYLIFGTSKRAISALSRGIRRNSQWCRWIGIHNCLYDLDILSNMGTPVPINRLSDSMVGAFNRCMDPQGLKPLCFRHFGMSMENYSDLVSPYSEKYELDYWCKVANLYPDMTPIPILEWKGGKPHVKNAYSVARRAKSLFTDIAKDKRNKKGEPVSPRKRWDDTPDEIRLPIVDVLGEMPSATLRDVYDAEPARATRYACRDADGGVRLTMEQAEVLTTEGLDRVHQIDMGVIPMAARMQRVGLYTDVSHFKSLSYEFGLEIDRLAFQIRELAGMPDLNPNSRDQISHLFFDVLKLKSGKKTSGGKRFEVNDTTLQINRNAHPIVPLFAEYSELTKLKGTYCDRLARFVGEDSRLRFQITTTRIPSGRFAAKNPNIMAIPTRSKRGRRIREGFIPTPESVCGKRRVLVTWDLSQIEMRVLAHESRDPLLVSIFERDEDMHIYTAARMLGPSAPDRLDYKTWKTVEPWKTYRSVFKNVGFGTVYLITPEGQVDQLAGFGITKFNNEPITTEHTKHWISEFWQLFPGCKSYMDSVVSFARRNAWVADMFGRRRYGHGVYSEIERVQQGAIRALCNHGIQSGATGYMKLAMIQIDDVFEGFRNEGVYVEALAQVHDELLVECDEDALDCVDAAVSSCMANAYQLRVPVKANMATGHNWAALEK